MRKTRRLQAVIAFLMAVNIISVGFASWTITAKAAEASGTMEAYDVINVELTGVEVFDYFSSAKGSYTYNGTTYTNPFVSYDPNGQLTAGNYGFIKLTYSVDIDKPVNFGVRIDVGFSDANLFNHIKISGSYGQSVASAKAFYVVGQTKSALNISTDSNNHNATIPSRQYTTDGTLEVYLLIMKKNEDTFSDTAFSDIWSKENADFTFKTTITGS